MIFLMENMHPTYDDRLRAHGERLLKALDAQPVPETYADILRAARALIAVKKALDLIHKAAAEVETKPRRAAKKPAPATTAEPAEEDDEDPPVLNRQMRRMADALARKEARAGDYRRHASG